MICLLQQTGNVTTYLKRGKTEDALKVILEFGFNGMARVRPL